MTVKTDMTEQPAEEKKEQTLDEAFAELEQIVKNLESGELGLEESFRNYEQGMRLIRECSAKIDLVEKQVLQMNESGELHEF